MIKRFLIVAAFVAALALPANAQWYASRIYPQPANPATCTAGAGEIIYNTTTQGIYTCNGGAWVPVGITGTSLTLAQGTLTASTPFINHTATWNAGAVTFQNIVSNVTNTASAAASTLLELQIGGTSLFTVYTSGSVQISGASILASSADGLFNATDSTGATLTRLTLGAETVAGTALIPDVVGGQTQGFIIGNGDGTTVSFAELAAATNGAIVYCDDCTKATPCAGAGTGALAKRYNGAWDCD